jgi:hypothetical protein
MTGWLGKCPMKKGSFTETFLNPTSFLSATISVTRSISKNGYRCGKSL